LLAVLWLLQGRSCILGVRACLFAFAYFLIALLPVLGLVDNFVFRYSLVFDHFQYLASMGPRGPAMRIPNKQSLCDLRDLLCRFFFVLFTQIRNLCSNQPSLRPTFCTGLLLFLGFATTDLGIWK
jgi:hypothetical protein